MKPVTIKRIPLDHVLAHEKILYNTNNHPYSDTELKPPDYREIIDMGNTKNWIDKFHKDNYKTIVLDKYDLTWMEKALQIGVNTRKFSHLFDDELAITCKKYDMPKNNNNNWFIRTDSVSLKEGMYGIGPYNSFENIIKSMVSTTPGHSCFKPNDESLTIYFMEWLNIDPNKEFRIFVFQNEITAISVQHLYNINHWLNTKSDLEIEQIVQKILDYFDKNIKEKMLYMTNYVMDLALIGLDETPYFIEPNSFGKCYAAGSSLYHWIYDHDTLHESDSIEFRYVNEY